MESETDQAKYARWLTTEDAVSLYDELIGDHPIAAVVCVTADALYLDTPRPAGTGSPHAQLRRITQAIDRCWCARDTEDTGSAEETGSAEPRPMDGCAAAARRPLDAFATDLETIAKGLALARSVNPWYLSMCTVHRNPLKFGYATFGTSERAGTLTTSADPRARAAVDAVTATPFRTRIAPPRDNLLEWIVYCGCCQSDHQTWTSDKLTRTRRILDGLKSDALDPEIALAFCIGIAPFTPANARVIAGVILAAAGRKLDRELGCRLQLPPVIV